MNKRIYVILAVLVLASMACNLALGVPDAPVPASIEAPAAAPASGIVSLNYDESNGDPLTANQSQLIALYFRPLEEDHFVSQKELEDIIPLIQAEAAATNATVFQGATLKLDQHWAWFIWCSDASNADFPADTADVFDTMPEGPGRVWIQIIFDDGVPLRTKDTFSGCNSPSGFWAVAVH